MNTFILSALVAISACLMSVATNPVPPVEQRQPTARSVSGEWVAIAGVRWDATEEQRELQRLFRGQGIKMSSEGSILYDVLVPSTQADQAVQLLRTNHLVMEGKVELLR